MSEFMDGEADVSEKEESSSDSEVDKPKKLKAKKSSKSKRQIDSSEEDDDDDEEDAEDLKDLINDDVEEEVDSDDGVGTKRKHADDDDEEDNEELDEEDLALLSENLGVSFENKKKKLKRVRRLSDGESDQDEVAEDPKNAIANELFDGDDEPLHRLKREEDDPADARYGGGGSDSEESDDEDDFIVDDADRPIKKPKRRRGQHRYNDEAMQQAQDVFGVEFDFDDISELPEFDDDYYEDQGEEEYEDDTEGAEGKSKRKKTKSKKDRRSIFDQYEPTELEKSHMTEEDREIREADVPERFLLRATKVKETQDEPEIEEEADWIYTQAFNTNTLTSQAPEGGRKPLAGQKEPQVILKIREALKYIRSNFLEVPFIATYRKEAVEGLDQSDLWTVYRWDEKYCLLQEKKKNMIRLFNNMLSYQIDLLGRNMTLGEQKIITDSDIERLATATTFEEIHDSYVYFKLHYSHQIPAMKVAVAKKERDKRKEARHKRKEEREIAKQEKLEAGEEMNEVDEPLSDMSEEEEDDEAISKRFSTIKLAQSKKEPYNVCKENSIGALANRFGLTAEQLGENIRDNYTKHEVQQFDRNPEDAAQDYICVRFPNTDQVLAAARLMVAKEISTNPLVRQCLRNIFHERGVVNVYPKEKAIKHPGLIDENHPCYPHKYLKAKPISSFTGDQFLQLLLAEKDELLHVDIVIDEYQNHELRRKHVDVIYSELYQVDAYSEVAVKWNEQRKLALELAFQKMLYPDLVAELKHKLKAEATSSIVIDAARRLRESLRVAPYVVTEQNILEDEEFSVVDGVRVMGFAFVPEFDQAAFAVVIDGDGDVLEHVRLPSFMLRTRQGSESKLRENDIVRLKNFIVSKKPHVIALGAESLQTRFILKELCEIIEQLTVEHDYPSIPVEVVDNELSTIYANSMRGKLEFPDWPELLRTAVSVARKLQDPLVEFAQLCSADDEILCLKLHHLQDKLLENPTTKDEFLEALNIEFINIVNAVGVDVNQAILHPHRAPLVQFIAGFGPRKAAGFLKTLKKLPQQVLESRTQLIMNCKFGAKVFINCAGFIKIDTSQLSDNSETYIEILDSTRVHPEAYEWARKMAVDALEYDEENEVNPSAALEEILQNPDKLKDLDLDAFAEELDKQGFGRKHTTLYDIRKELSCRYKDPREPYTAPTAELLFTMLTKETPNTLYTGKLVTARVTKIVRKQPAQEELDAAEPKRAGNEDDDTGLWKCPFCLKADFNELSDVWNHFDAGSCPGIPLGVGCVLENGLNGFIKLEKLSNDPVTDPEEKVRVGQIIHARVLSIKVDKFTVDLTCRSNDLNDVNFEFRPEKDTNYYDFSRELEDEATEEAKKKKTKRQSYVKRIIVHPCFHNVDYKKAEAMMSKMSQGDAIIRPSSKGQDHLTLTWKVCKGINQHVDILEKGKDNAFSLGSQLFINNEAYEDLDEIIARYVTPMAGYARDLTSFKYFRNAEGGKPDIMEKYLVDERARQPSKIHYFISASKQYPGKFILSYFPRNKAVHEYVTVTHEGFKFRGKLFHSVNHLFKWFKEHFRDPLPQRTPMQTPGAQSNPPETPLESASRFDQNIQRVAAMMPPQIFNTLSQVSGSTPYGSTPANQRSSSNMPPPSGTPSYGTSQRTPGYSTPSQNAYRSGMPPPSSRGYPRSDSKGGSGGDWSNIAGSWSQGGGRRPVSRTPRTPNYATPGASSQMSISPTQTPGNSSLHPGGDQTPLEDEWQ